MQESIKYIHDSQRLLKASEVARILNISKSMVYRLMKNGKIPYVRINQAFRIHPEDLDKFLEGNRIEADKYSIRS